MSSPFPGTSQSEDPTVSLPPVGRTSWPSLGAHPWPRADSPGERPGAGWAGGHLAVLASGELLVLQSSLPQAGSLELRPAWPRGLS